MTEPLTGARRPSDTDPPLGGTQVTRAVNELAPYTVPRFGTAAERDAAYSAYVVGGGVMRDGMRCAVGSVQYARAGGTWQVMWTPPTTVSVSTWQNLTLASGWTVGANGARYRVLNGVCYYQVHAVRGTWPADTLVLTLPAGARPPFTHWPSGVWGGLFVSNLVVSADGTVKVSLTEGSGGAGGIVFSGSHPVAS